jgi:hypothetical protein
MTNRHTYRTLAQYFFDTEDTDFNLRAGVEHDFDDEAEYLDRLEQSVLNVLWDSKVAKEERV